MRRLRKFGLWLAVIVGLLAIPELYIAVGCQGEASGDTLGSPLPAEIRTKLDTVPGYQFPEEKSFLTFPEWYIVYTSQDYAAHIAQRPPSSFRFFASAADFWTSYCAVNRHVSVRYPYNFGVHAMIYVIGVSHSAEYALKGIYENTLGRVSELFAPVPPTAEEVFAQGFASDYGAWLNTTPWYDFPFLDRLKRLWNDVPWWGEAPYRKIERRLVLTAELSAKSAYGWLIQGGTQAAYDPAELEIKAVMHGLPADLAAVDARMKIVEDLGGENFLVLLPRYQPFTDIVKKLAGTDAQFVEIGGNDELLVSLTVPAGWAAPAEIPAPLFSFDNLSPTGGQRVGIKIAVSSLMNVVKAVNSSGASVEHVYDY